MLRREIHSMVATGRCNVRQVAAENGSLFNCCGSLRAARVITATAKAKQIAALVAKVSCHQSKYKKEDLPRPSEKFPLRKKVDNVLRLNGRSFIVNKKI